MAYILHIESATDVCSVALGNAGVLVAERHSEEARQHISHLSLLIDDLLTAQGMAYRDLEAVAVSAGPGSYTGLRVGYATAKGLCLGLNVPLIEVDTLYSIAWAMKDQLPGRNAYVPMIDARRMEVYSAIFDHDLNECVAAKPWILDNQSLQRLLDEYSHVVIGGNGAFKVDQFELELEGGKSMIISDVECNSAYLIAKSWTQFKEGHHADLAYCEPRYLKPPNITTPKKVFNVG